MTKALQEAFGEAAKLGESEQDSLAAAIRAEIAAPLSQACHTASKPALARPTDS